MAENPDDCDELFLSDADRDTLEEHCKKGELDRRMAELREFFKRHLNELRLLIPNPDDDVEVLKQLKSLIIRKVIIDHASEMMDQAKEIQNHFWIEGEKGNHAQDSLFFEWAIHHAPNWRRWRMLNYLFVAEKRGVDMYRALLRESES